MILSNRKTNARLSESHIGLRFLFVLQSIHLYYSTDHHLLFIVACSHCSVCFILVAAQKVAIKREISLDRWTISNLASK